MPRRLILLSTAVSTLAAAATVAGAGSATASSATASSAGRSGSAARAAHCAPSWRLTPTPAIPGSGTVSIYPVLGGQDSADDGVSLSQLSLAAEAGSVSAIAPGDAIFTGDAEVPVDTAWNMRWNGHALSTLDQPGATALPYGNAASSSFDSDSDGWQIGAQTATGAGLASAPLSERWHGGRWTVIATAAVPSAADGGTVQLSQVSSLSPDNAWIVGGFAADGQHPLAERWDGTRWAVVPTAAADTQNSELNALTVVSRNDIWAVGDQWNSGAEQTPLAEHWDGVSWRVVSVPGVGFLSAVSAASSHDVWATGGQQVGDNVMPFAAHWDGSAWTVMPLPEAGLGGAVVVYAAGPRDVWLAGNDTSSGRPGSFLHYDGKAWNTVPEPVPAEYGISYDFGNLGGTGPADVWATGSAFNSADLTQTPLVAHLSCGSEGSRHA